MWTVNAVLSRGERQIRPLAQQSGDLPSSRLALALLHSQGNSLRGWLPPETLLQHLVSETEEEEDSLFSSARRPVQMVVRHLGRELDEALEQTDLMPNVLGLFHLPTLVVLPVFGDEVSIELTYELETLGHSFWPWLRSDCFALDWRAYLGAGTAIIDGQTSSDPRSRDWRDPQPLRFVLRNLQRRSGYLVGFILRHVRSRKVRLLPSDPTFLDRRRKMEAAHRSLANYISSLDEMQPVTGECAAVFVHGTGSHGLVGLRDLAPFEPAPIPLFRHEHDTFLPVAKNGSELAALIGSKLRTNSLTLIAHSRGGLVARFARAKLKRSGFPGDVKIVTFGTPHLGTPLVNALRDNASALFRIGKMCSFGVPQLTAL